MQKFIAIFFFLFANKASALLSLPKIVEGSAEVKLINQTLYITANEPTTLCWTTLRLTEDESIVIDSQHSEVMILVEEEVFENSGKITSNGYFLLSAPSIYCQKMSSIECSQLTVAADGEIKIEGNISLSENEKGGNLVIFGEIISLCNAKIDLSGDEGGGMLVMGRGSQFIPSSKMVFIDDQTIISAQANLAGRGGIVDIWSENVTQFEGNINLQGGALSGDGGSAEISSRNNLKFHGTVDRRASNGKPGLLHLDPEADISIQSSGTATGSFSNGDPDIYSPASPSNVILIGPGPGSLIDQLALGDVLIQTTYGGTDGPNGGRITVVDDLIYSVTNNLTLEANGENVVINARLENDSTGNIEIQAPNGSVIVTPSSGNDATLLTGGDLIIQNVSGDLELTGGNGIDEHAVIGNESPFISTGNVTINISGNLQLTGGHNTGSYARISAQDGSININADGNITLAGGTNALTDVQIVSSPGGPISVISGGNITLEGSSFAADKMFIGNDTTDAVNISCVDLRLVANSVNNSAVIGTEGNLTVTITGNLHMQSSALGAESALVGKTSAILDLEPTSRISIENGTLDSPDFQINF